MRERDRKIYERIREVGERTKNEKTIMITEKET